MAEPIIARAQAGDTLDALVDRAVGRTSGVVEAVLLANPGLADLVVLPQGAAVTIPAAAQAPPAADLIDLWD